MSFERPSQPDIETLPTEKPNSNDFVVNRMGAEELESFINETNASVERTEEQIKNLKSELLSTKESLKEAKWYEFILRITGCTREQVAYKSDELSDETKVYIGPWSFEAYQDIKQYPNVSNVWKPETEQFTQLLRARVIFGNLATDSRINTPQAAIEALVSAGVDTYQMRDEQSQLVRAINKIEFSQEQAEYKLVEFSPRNLGFEDSVTREDFFAKAQSLGLQLCPPEVAIFLEIQDNQEYQEAKAKGNPNRHNSWNLAMEAITVLAPNGESDTSVHFFDSAFDGFKVGKPERTISLDSEYVFLDTKG